jgi:predicted PurR-regulated permease PerM
VSAAKHPVRRDQVVLLVLALLSLGVGYLCLQLVLPFVSPLTWAVTLAVIAHPLYANGCSGASSKAASRRRWPRSS